MRGDEDMVVERQGTI